MSPSLFWWWINRVQKVQASTGDRHSLPSLYSKASPDSEPAKQTHTAKGLSSGSSLIRGSRQWNYLHPHLCLYKWTGDPGLTQCISYVAPRWVKGIASDLNKTSLSQPQTFTKTTDKETLLFLGLPCWQDARAAESRLTQHRERLPEWGARTEESRGERWSEMNPNNILGVPGSCCTWSCFSLSSLKPGFYPWTFPARANNVCFKAPIFKSQF